LNFKNIFDIDFRAIENVKLMPEAKYINLKSVFVSVDPDRDTFERI
jgi:cytochrome oxidase Cu insertion factor (SCO1/SenC/PrrC family)